jgi:hypothetical protein
MASFAALNIRVGALLTSRQTAKDITDEIYALEGILRWRGTRTTLEQSIRQLTKELGAIPTEDSSTSGLSDPDLYAKIRELNTSKDRLKQEASRSADSVKRDLTATTRVYESQIQNAETEKSDHASEMQKHAVSGDMARFNIEKLAMHSCDIIIAKLQVNMLLEKQKIDPAHFDKDLCIAFKAKRAVLTPEDYRGMTRGARQMEIAHAHAENKIRAADNERMADAFAHNPDYRGIFESIAFNKEQIGECNTLTQFLESLP